VAGIVHLTAPEAKIMPLRVLDSDGTGNVFLVAEAIQYAVRNGADVINLSLSSRRESDLLEDVFEDLVPEDDDDDDDDNEADALVGVPPEGLVVVGAAGNANSDAPRYPAAEEGAIAVAAVNEEEKKAEFSNYDTTGEEKWIDVSAPGETIYSTFPTDKSPSGYASWSGTSMATPFVAGQAALIRSIRPLLRPEADPGQPSVENYIKNTARSLDAKNPDYVGRLGAGHADAGASLRAAKPAPPPNTAPTVTAMSPRAGARIKNRRPAISSTVRDARTNLAKSNIVLYVDGRRKNFSYNTATDRLIYRSPRLSYSRHSVRIVARDPQGLVGNRAWVFRVVR
jgi:thermitase